MSHAASTTVVLVPSPPLLLPEYVGLADPGAELRTRCVAALDVVLGAADDPGGTVEEVLVVCGHDPLADPLLRPLGVRVGRHLLSLAGWTGPVDELVVPATGPFQPDLDRLADLSRFVDPDQLADSDRLADLDPRRRLVLVVGDGSARRSEKAPGHLDEGSFAVDESILAALATGDTAALLALDPDTCDALMVTGRAPLQHVAHLLRGRRVEADLVWSGDPWGVMYWVAVWRVPPG